MKLSKYFKEESLPDTDKEILRKAIMAELEAINLYEHMADSSKDNALKKLLLHVVKEEKTHVEEFSAMLGVRHIRV
jgi:rubrerythrin